MLGPLLFDNRGFIVKHFALQKKNFNRKNFFLQKSLFHNKFFFWTWNWKMLWRKKDAQGSHYWAQKKFQQEKIKIEGVAFISKKYLKSHFRDPQPDWVFFVYFLLKLIYLHKKMHKKYSVWLYTLVPRKDLFWFNVYRPCTVGCTEIWSN